MRIEILHFDGCPNHEQLPEHLPRLFEREGIDAEIERVSTARDPLTKLAKLQRLNRRHAQLIEALPRSNAPTRPTSQ